MNTADKDIMECVEAFVPPASEDYKRMIADTVSELGEKAARGSRPARRLWKPIAAAAAALAVLFAASAAVLGAARPALAAEIPGVNGIVYAASRERAADEADLESIEDLISRAVNALALCDYNSASSCFRNGFMNEDGNYLAAAYLNYLLTFGEARVGGTRAAEIVVEDLQAEQKAFRYTARAALELVSKDGTSQGSEECEVSIWENKDGMYIEKIAFGSEGYRSYEAMYAAKMGAAPSRLTDYVLIPIDNGILGYSRILTADEEAVARVEAWNRLLLNLDLTPASTPEKTARARLIHGEIVSAEGQITPETVTCEELAAELMYRYWLGAKTGEVSDFSDILEHNEQTDLFLWDALLNAEKVQMGISKPLVTVEADDAPIVNKMEETDKFVRAWVYVYTDISDGVSQGVGEEIVLTLGKTEGGYTIIGFDREVGDGLYTGSLKPLAKRFKAEGHAWQEAGQMAYDEIHARLESDAGIINGD